MRKHYIVILWLSLCHFSLHGQADSILLLPEQDRIKAIWDWLQPWSAGDTLYHLQRIDRLEKEFKERKQDALAKQVYIMRVYYRVGWVRSYYGGSNSFIDKALDEARERGWPLVEAEVLAIKGNTYFVQAKWGQAFEYLQRAYQKMSALGFDKYPHLRKYLTMIGQCYLEFGDYEGAIPFLRESIAFPENEKHKISVQSLNTIGVCFMKMMQYDSAKLYFEKEYQLAVEQNHPFWAALAHGNIGNIYFKQGKYDEALPLLEEDFRESLKMGEYMSAVNSALALTTIYLQLHDLEKSEYYLNFSKKHIDLRDIRVLPEYYKNMANISRLKGNEKQAFLYLDSFIVVHEELKNLMDERIIHQAKLKLEVEHHANAIRLLEVQRNRQLLLRNGIIIILLLTGVIGTLLLHQKNIGRKRQMELAEMQRVAAEAELDRAKIELKDFTRTLLEKNELIESFRRELDNMEVTKIEQDQERGVALAQLMNSTILTDDDWKRFRILFDKVHPGFFGKLKDAFKDLTPAETRFMVLSKLELTPNEMAAMLGVTYDAIKKTRQRMLRKIDLPEDRDLDEVIRNL